MEVNFIVIALAALIPMFMGMIWYHPKVFGTIWMKTSGVGEMEPPKGKDMVLMMGLSYVYAFLIGFSISFIVIHQYHIYSILVNEPGYAESGSVVQSLIDSFMSNYGQNFRTFKHGVFHGIFNGILFVFPLIATSALFEKKSFKYTLVGAGYWTASIALMGGVICQFS